MTPEQGRHPHGTFAPKGDTIRAVRSIRLTDATWHSLGDRADELDITKADYLEGLVSGSIDWESDDSESDKPDLDFDIEELFEILQNVYVSKQRGNRHFKEAIEKVFELANRDLEKEE